MISQWTHAVNVIDDMYQYNGRNLSVVGRDISNKLIKSKLFPKKYVDSLIECISHNDPDAFDRAMGRIYDFADNNGIWLGA